MMRNMTIFRFMVGYLGLELYARVLVCERVGLEVRLPGNNGLGFCVLH
jgi:hypothetical protein